MMPGDIPCNVHCENTLCHYCIFGLCMDNAPCEDRTGDAEERGAK